MMKESPLNPDEKTGGLSGNQVPPDAAPKAPQGGPSGAATPGKRREDDEDGPVDDLGGLVPRAAVPQGLAGVKVPDRLAGIRLDRGGRAVGLALPALGDRADVVTAWRALLGGGPLYVRCDERAAVPPLAHVQRLARVGELWLDAPLGSDEDQLELMVAGAHRLVVWPDQPDADLTLESLGDSALLGWDGKTPWDEAAAKAAALGVAVLALAAPPAAAAVDVYQASLPTGGRFDVLRVPASPLPDAVDGDGALPDGDGEDE